MKIIGLTGGIGSGKTTVANMFAQLGIPVYIADVEAKKLMNTSMTIREKLIALLGSEAYGDEGLNRAFVADKIFSNATLLEAVNAIIHPEVAMHFNGWVAMQNSKYVVKEAAILFENGGYKHCDINILVTAPKKVRIQRVVQRDNTTEAAVTQRMDNQWSDAEKEKLADIVIENTDLKATQKTVLEIHQSLINLPID